MSLTVPPNMMLEVEPDDEKRYFAVIKLAQESKESEYGSKQRPDFQITMVKLTTDGPEQNQFAELDQQLVGCGETTYEVKVCLSYVFSTWKYVHHSTKNSGEIE